MRPLVTIMASRHKVCQIWGFGGKLVSIQTHKPIPISEIESYGLCHQAWYRGCSNTRDTTASLAVEHY